MSVKSTRLLADGSSIDAFPLSSFDIFNGAAGGYCPFENLLLPGATMEFLHAAIGPDGFREFASIDSPATYAADPDKRYKVKTRSGSITVPAGSQFNPSGTAGVPGTVTYYAKTTTDDRVTTYSLDYSVNQTGWIITETGSATTGERFAHATVEEGTDRPATTIILPTASALTKRAGATVYGGGGIVETLSDVALLGEMKTWCESKLTDLKKKIDVADSGIAAEPALDSYHKEDLRIKISTARMKWTGSGMFNPLKGSFSYFVSPMAPDFTLTSGTWKLAVSEVIPENERYFDAAGMYGESTWWDAEHSLFGSAVYDQTVRLDLSGTGYNLAIYPNKGVSSLIYYSPWKKSHHRLVCYDGKKRKIEFKYRREGSDQSQTEELTTSAQDGFANATDYLQLTSSETEDFINLITKIWTFDDNGDSVIVYDRASNDDNAGAGAGPAILAGSFFVLTKHRQKYTWGYRGFTRQIAPEQPADPEAPRLPYPDPLDIFYKTITIKSSSLAHVAKNATTPPASLVGMSSAGEMSGAYTLTQPSKWKLGSLEARDAWSKTDKDNSPPFKLEWTAAGKSGSYEIKVSISTEYVSVANPPFNGSGDEITITETEYRVNVAPPPAAYIPDRLYRLTWPRINGSPKATPKVVTKTFSLAGPEGNFKDAAYTTLQKSKWQDLGLPDSGDSWVSDPADEFAAFVGSKA